MDRNRPSPGQRDRLAAKLRELRLGAGLSGDELAARLGWSQSKVSKIENGRTLPSSADIDSWAAGTGAADPVRSELEELLDAVLAEARAWKAAHRGGLARRQVEVSELEARCSLIRYFQSAVVPGLLQTADYARRVLTLADTSGQGDAASAVIARLERQRILYDVTKSFQFVLTEAALRWSPGPPNLLRAQLDRLQSLSTLPAVDLAVIPLAREASRLHLNGFLLFEAHDEPLVMIETYTRELLLTESGEVMFYRSLHADLQESALHGDDAHRFIEGLKAETVDR